MSQLNNNEKWLANPLLLMLKHNQIHMESGGEWELGSCELAKRQNWKDWGM